MKGTNYGYNLPFKISKDSKKNIQFAEVSSIKYERFHKGIEQCINKQNLEFYIPHLVKEQNLTYDEKVHSELDPEIGYFQAEDDAQLVYHSSIPSAKSPNRNAFAIYQTLDTKYMIFYTMNGLNIIKKKVSY